MFTILFALSTGAYSSVRHSHLFYRLLTCYTAPAVHLWQALRVRAWWLLFTVILAGGGEVAGWYAREWSHDQPLNDTPFTIQ